jgi:hypothetical protein
MDTALGRRTYQGQVMNSYVKGNKAPFIPKLSAGVTIERLELLLRFRASPRTKSVMTEALPEVPRRFLQSVQANVHIAP